MALGSNHRTTTTEANFIPELWSDEVIGAYKSNLVIANLCHKIGMTNKAGDTVHVPKPVRGSASAKSANTAVTLVGTTATVLNVSIDQHWHYAQMIEDITAVQALESSRRFYTDDAGYALAKQVDTTLGANAATWQSGSAYSTAVIGSDGSTVWDGTANTNTGNGATITDAGLRRSIQTLDDSDVPFNDRSLVIPPSEKNALFGIDKFVNRDYRVDSVASVQSGMMGDIYGVKVYTSTNLATVQAADSSTNYKACLLMHKEALVLVEQLGIRVQSQYDLEFLGDLMVADTIFGTSEYRDEAGVAIIVPA